MHEHYQSYSLAKCFWHGVSSAYNYWSAEPWIKYHINSVKNPVLAVTCIVIKDKSLNLLQLWLFHLSNCVHLRALAALCCETVGLENVREKKSDFPELSAVEKTRRSSILFQRKQSQINMLDEQLNWAFTSHCVKLL